MDDQAFTAALSPRQAAQGLFGSAYFPAFTCTWSSEIHHLSSAAAIWDDATYGDILTSLQAFGNFARLERAPMMIRRKSFGAQDGGGRRTNERVAAGLPATLVSLKLRHRAILLEISTTGARVRAEDPPKRGSEVFLVLEHLDVFARIVWKSGELCGLKFDSEIRAWDVQLIRTKAAQGAAARLTPQQKGGVDDWKSGVAR